MNYIPRALKCSVPALASGTAHSPSTIPTSPIDATAVIPSIQLISALASQHHSIPYHTYFQRVTTPRLSLLPSNSVQTQDPACMIECVRETLDGSATVR